jgi:putative transposase
MATLAEMLELVRHFDRGVQHGSKDYTDRLKACGIQISVSRRGNPYDNDRSGS